MSILPLDPEKQAALQKVLDEFIISARAMRDLGTPEICQGMFEEYYGLTAEEADTIMQLVEGSYRLGTSTLPPVKED